MNPFIQHHEALEVHKRWERGQVHKLFGVDLLRYASSDIEAVREKHGLVNDDLLRAQVRARRNAAKRRRAAEDRAKAKELGITIEELRRRRKEGGNDN